PPPRPRQRWRERRANARMRPPRSRAEWPLRAGCRRLPTLCLLMLARVSLTTAPQAVPVRDAVGPAGGWRGWLGPVLMGVLAALLRLPGLGRPHALVFDETYYAKDGLALLLFGHEMDAKENANEMLLALDGDDVEAAATIFKDSPAYVV